MHEKAEKFKIYRDVYDMIFHYYGEDDWRKRLSDAGFSQINIDYAFSGRHLFCYDLLNMQVYFLKFFYAERALQFLARHRWLRELTIKATERIASYVIAKPVTKDTATRYVIRATK